MRNQRGKLLFTMVSTRTTSFAEPHTPKLDFEVQDGKYVLSQVWPGDAFTGYQLSVPQPMKVVAEDGPESTTKPTAVLQQ